MLRVVDRFEGRAWLEWWANSSTCLARVEVAVVIDAIHGGWDASGRVVNGADLEGFKFLYDLGAAIVPPEPDSAAVLPSEGSYQVDMALGVTMPTHRTASRSPRGGSRPGGWCKRRPPVIRVGF